LTPDVTVQELPPYRPKVDEASEFLEISRDFTRPQEILREAVSNAYDAKASVIQIDVYTDRSAGEEQLVVRIEDNGQGMKEADLRAFFDLGRSTRNVLDGRGFRLGDFIGSKGHGTKIYYNSSRIEVETWREGVLLRAHVEDPKKHLNRKDLPEVKPQRSIPGPEGSGTIVTVTGYNNNQPRGFGHRELKDYIYWFTKWASFEKELGRAENNGKLIHLKASRIRTHVPRGEYIHDRSPQTGPRRSDAVFREEMDLPHGTSPRTSASLLGHDCLPRGRLRETPAQ